jgi:parallel beta-helix repeat protein
VELVPGDPAAFMSYVRFNDDHDDGQLSALRERLSTEVQAQIGEEFPIFQDRNDIAWGQSWQQRIDETLDAVTLLLVIITPGLFRSPPCRTEVARFVERERSLGRQDLILPVYYISAREMDDPALRDGDELARVLAARQFADWRELRFEAFTSPVVRKAIAQLAARMRDAFWRPPGAAPPGPARAGRPVSSPEQAEQASTPERVIAKTEPPTHVVDAYQRGDFATVGAAIKASRPGDRILVRPGLYEEALIVDKPLEILGDGPVPDIEIRARGAHTLQFKASIGRVANLTLRQAGGQGTWYGVDITQGRLDLEGCDITSQTGPCVGIHDGADPRLRRNHIHDGKTAGVIIYDDGRGTLEDNDIASNSYSGVQIQTGGDPTLRRNQIHDGKTAGVIVHENGRGTLEDNDIAGNTYSGVAIKAGGDPTLRRNQIHDGKQDGVYVYENGRGTLEDNEITGNGYTGVTIKTGGDPTLRHNKINHNTYHAVRVFEGGRGTLEDNDLTGNARGAWAIADDCLDNVTRARNKE